ncbi:hypothetical protein [Burkholderia pseudomultivorans]|uniref:Uncharacterized protein n=1 Tax=Burkholderia pseudomultivorans TaxID=1207504 RepID=A0A132EID6_9BURK|nr:hypothetical protein [Burkholderia pseudomultivorans]KWF29878.1 hypothetical protein WT56_15955 [Burkholderia pseudomultivorans]
MTHDDIMATAGLYSEVDHAGYVRFTEDDLVNFAQALLAAPAEAREPIGTHDLSTSAGGRAYVAEFFAKRLRRHDFGSYIAERLAADFACALAAYLRDHERTPADAHKPPAVGFRTRVPGFDWVPWLTDDQETIRKALEDARSIGSDACELYAEPPAARVGSLTDDQINTITSKWAARWSASGAWTTRRCIDNALREARSLLNGADHD